MCVCVCVSVCVCARARVGRGEGRKSMHTPEWLHLSSPWNLDCINSKRSLMAIVQEHRSHKYSHFHLQHVLGQVQVLVVFIQAHPSSIEDFQPSKILLCSVQHSVFAA